jgi:formylglycine-generating enzyme required for sulfatase activity
MSQFLFAGTARVALLLAALLVASGCASEGDLPAAPQTEGSATPAPDTGAVAAPGDVKEDAPNSDAGVDAEDVLSLDAAGSTRSQGNLAITSFSYCNSDLDCPNGMGSCITQLPLNRIAAGGSAITVAINALPGFRDVIPTNTAGVCSLGCTDHPEVCAIGLRVGADSTPWSCQLVYAGASPYPATGLPFTPNAAELSAGPAYGSLCRPPFERAAAYSPDFCDSCSATDRCENSSACIDDAPSSGKAADQRAGHCLVACNATAANACPTGFSCRLPGTGELQLGTPKEGSFCFPTLGTCTSCLDRDGDKVGLGGCTAAGGASAVDCDDTRPGIYFDAAKPDHAFPASCGANLDANCNGRSDDTEQIGVTDADGNLIYGAQHCNGCFSACGGSEGSGEATASRNCEVTGQGGAFGNVSACLPSCDFPDRRVDCSTSATDRDGCETPIDGRASLRIRDCDADRHGDASATASDLLFACAGVSVSAVNPRDGSSCATVPVLPTGDYGDDCDDTQSRVTPGKTEVCDGLDNDCDGRGDASVSGVGENCTNPTAVGACRSGRRLCGPGTEGLVCVASSPTVEVCNGVDDDCNGAADNLAPGVRLFDDAGTSHIVGDACTVPNKLGVCAEGTWQCSGLGAGFGAACVGPEPTAGDAFNDPDLLDTNCDGVDGLITEAIFVNTGGANRAGTAGSVASISFGPRALGTFNNPVGSLRIAFELIAQRSSTSETKIRQIHIGGSQTPYQMPSGLALGIADANFAMVGGYDVVLATGGFAWTAGSSGTQLIFDAGNAFGTNVCGQNGVACTTPLDDIQAIITVTNPSNIVFRHLNATVGQPLPGFGPVAGIKCSVTGSGSCAGLILDGVGLRLDIGADGGRGDEGPSFINSASASSPIADVAGAPGLSGCRGQGTGGSGGAGAAIPTNRRSGFSAADLAYGSGAGGQVSATETSMFGESGFVPRDPAFAAEGGVSAATTYPLSLFTSGAGSPGRAGGGGGGGGGWKNRGGGGGAAGGCGGGGGTAGTPGGSVFGLVNLDPRSLPTTNAFSIEISSGGMGGMGGGGGTGQQGGAQTKSPISFTTPFLDAAKWTADGGNNDWFAAGGAGGSGGGGGGGAGGPGGWVVGVAKSADLAIPPTIELAIGTGGIGGMGGMGGMGGVIATGVGGGLPISGNQGAGGADGGALLSCAIDAATSGDVSCASPTLLALGETCQLNSECASGRCANGADGSLNDRCAPAGMNYLPAGSFFMGSYAGEPAHQLDELHHRVALTQPFFLDATEVTQAVWTAFSGGTNPSCFQSASATCSTAAAASNSPVENLDFYSALGFANARSAKEGLTSCYTLIGCEAPVVTTGTVTGTSCAAGFTYTAPVAAVAAAAASCLQFALPTGANCEAGFTYTAATGGGPATCIRSATPATAAPYCAPGFFYNPPITAVGAVAASCRQETGAWRDGQFLACSGYTQVAACTGYRLPTEAEWEYAARAGATDARYCGNAYNGDYLWEQSNADGAIYTRAVAGRQPNAFGLYDMLGNVSELVADGYAKLYPNGAINPFISGSNVSLSRINRGGAINQTGFYVYGRQHAGTVTTRSSFVGLRLARTVQSGGATPAVAAVSCVAGFHAEAGRCTSNVRTCTTEHGAGIQTYGALGWTAAGCVAQLCDNGYQQVGNGCKASYGTLCGSDLECAEGYCAMAAAGANNDRCAPVGMVTIPKGTFLKRVGPSTTANFTISRSFFMDETETTQAAWKSLSGGLNPSCQQSVSWRGDCDTANNFDAGPVESVDWYAAMAFANARSAAQGLQECYNLVGCPNVATDANAWKDGLYACTGVATPNVAAGVAVYAPLNCTGYRLPTEMEWEYAARAGNTEEPLGSSIGFLNTLNPSVTDYWTADTSGLRARPVKTKPGDNSNPAPAVAGTPNRSGLYDMAGNVWELVEDFEATSPYWPQSDTIDYQGRSGTGEEVILRGGGFLTSFSNGLSHSYLGVPDSNAFAFSTAHRTYGPRSSKNRTVGFRLVRSVVQPPAGGDCGAGFHLDAVANVCESDARACYIAGTTGYNNWDGDAWGSCQKCAPGSVSQPAISTLTTALTGIVFDSGTTRYDCIPVADQPTTGTATLCSPNGVVTNGTAIPLAGDTSGRLDFSTTTGALTGNGTDSSFGFRDTTTPVPSRSDKFSVTLTAGQSLFAKASSTGLRGALDRFTPVLYLYGDDPAADGSQCNRLVTASGNASAFNTTGADGAGAGGSSESEAVIRFRAPASGTYYLIVTSFEAAAATALPYNLVLNTGKELGEACTLDSQCASRSCSLGDVSNDAPYDEAGRLPALPNALKVCTPDPESAWPTGLSVGDRNFGNPYTKTRSDMVLIPAGSFLMGSPTTEKWRTSVANGIFGEESQHRVTISRPFYLQRLETTEGAWARVTGNQRNATANRFFPLNLTDYNSAVGYANELSRREGLTECYSVTCESGRVNSWIDGGALATECSAVALTSASCTGYRLPTESEWEYAARAGTTGAIFNAGQADEGALNDIAVWATSERTAGGTKAPNSWGLYDIIGNNFEYVHDSYAAYPTAVNSIDPGLASPANKAVILRGGSYDGTNVWNRASSRYNFGGESGLNSDARSRYLNQNVGFRLARTAITPLSAGTPCAPGYHASGTICDVDQIACYLENAAAAYQSWNGTAFGSCIASSCTAGFHMEGGSCLTNAKTCSSASGTGVQRWSSGTTYGACLQPVGGRCAASSECDSNNCPGATSGLPDRRCAPTGMIYLPPATYTAGSPNNEAFAQASESLYQATISRGLFIGTTEVTQGQWQAISGGYPNNPSLNQSVTCNSRGCVHNNPNDPVENMNWYAAAAYANARSLAEGLAPCYELRQANSGDSYDTDWRDGYSKQVTSLAGLACGGYRLPTDAEWEYAARAGTSGPRYDLPAGSTAGSETKLSAIAWYQNNATGTQPVGGKLPNAFGLYDMFGNVAEWSNDSYSANPTTGQTDPLDHVTWSGYRHYRGAAFNNLNGIRAALLEYLDAEERSGRIGLRLVRTPVLTALRGLCPSGYHAVGTLCEPDLQACATTAVNAVGTAKSWNPGSSSFGPCVPYNCATGFHLEGDFCISNSKTCTVGSQTGVQNWNAGTSYSACKLPLGALCTADADCATTTLAPAYCATGPMGTANDRCAPAGMNYLPAGSFVMGSPTGETGRNSNELQHQVTLSRPIFMATKEVTQAEWSALAGDFNPSCFQATTGTTCATLLMAGTANPNGPVERLDWFSAVGYANAKSESEGLTPCYTVSVATKGESWADGDYIFGTGPANTHMPTLNCTGYRLPTEAEWEYAARAGTTGAIYNAANPLTPTQAELDLIAWNANNAGARTQSGALKTANAWGLYDMIGNVWEYQWDTPAAYPNTAVTDPIGAISGNRGTRGHGYEVNLASARSARRFERDPASGDNGNGASSNIGIRLVRTAVLPVAQSACPTGYHVNTTDNVCDPNTIACSQPSALAASQDWNGTAYGACPLPCAGIAPAACAGACSSDGAATITAAQTVTGALAATDSANSVRGSGYYFDKYAITLTAGQRVRIALTAMGSNWDTFLYLTGGTTCGVITYDDDSLDNANSVINFTAPSAGTYYLHATSYGALVVGGYTVVTSAW